MTKAFIITTLIACGPLSTWAQGNSERGLFDSLLGNRVQECKEHFDIEPYLSIAIGAQQDDRITMDVFRSIQNFSSTGRLIIPESKLRDVTAVKCAIYAEGLLAGGIASQLVSSLGKAVGKAIGDGMGKAFEVMGQNIGEEVNQELSKTEEK